MSMVNWANTVTAFLSSAINTFLLILVRRSHGCLQPVPQCIYYGVTLTVANPFMSGTNKRTHHFEARIQAWGNSMGLRITRAVSEAARLEKGALVTMELTDDGLLIRPKQSSAKVWSEDELLEGITPYKAHADELPKLFSHEYQD